MYFSRINLNGLQLKPSNDFMCDITGLFDGDNDVTLNDYLGDGASFGNSRVKAKEIEILIGFKGFGIEKEKQMLAINRIRALKGLIKLQVETELLGIVETNVAVIGTKIDDDLYITLKCTAPDPYLYTTFPKTIELEKVTEGGKTYNYTYNYQYNCKTIGNTGTIINDGIVTAYPVITIVGSGSNITITNKNTGEKMNIDYCLEEGIELVIDNRLSTRGVYINNEPTPSIMTGNYITCIEGENEFEVDYIGDCSVVIELQEAYL